MEWQLCYPGQRGAVQGGWWLFSSRGVGGPSPSGMSLSESSPSLDLGGFSELLLWWGEGAPHSSSGASLIWAAPLLLLGRHPDGEVGLAALPGPPWVSSLARARLAAFARRRLAAPPAGSWATKWLLLNSGGPVRAAWLALSRQLAWVHTTCAYPLRPSGCIAAGAELGWGGSRLVFHLMPLA